MEKEFLMVKQMNKIEKLWALDLEMNQPSGKIIQIGACIGYADTRVVGPKFSVIIDPEEPISDEIAELTGVTQKRVNEESVLLIDGYKRLVDFFNQYQPFMNPLTWGGPDVVELKEQVVIQQLRQEGEMDPDVFPREFPKNWPFGRRWLDVKTVYIAYRMANGDTIQSGLARSMTKLGLAFDGRKHDAADDAANTIRVYFELLDRMKDV